MTSADLVYSLRKKMSPFAKGLPPKEGVMLGYILGEDWVEPQILSAGIADNGKVVVDSKGFDEPMWWGDFDEMVLLWEGMIAKANLTPEEHTLADRTFLSRFRGGSA